MSARKPLLDALVSMLTPRDVLVSCLGANARYLPHMRVPSPVFALCDSMGAAVPLALGMALQRSDRHVVALEGDGSLLMSPNVLATVAAARPPNLSILLWVNGRYESSGGQALPSAPVDWAALARAAGIHHVENVRDVAGLRAEFPKAREAAGPAVLVVEVAFDPAEPIPPYSERPEEIRARFRIE
ncbi:MAG TPA: thiamine pyrophosphate-dependent enzyme [Methylomirabilota bacterium]|nr:thiamine pyrophosphate-dependent enzyme [Methylomirabilota bacterium]